MTGVLGLRQCNRLMDDIDLTSAIFAKVYELHDRSRTFVCPRGWPLGDSGSAVPPLIACRLSPQQHGMLWVGSSEQLRVSLETLLYGAQEKTFLFPGDSCWPTQQPHLLGLLQRFYEKDQGGREPAMLWSFPFCCTHNWELKQIDAVPQGGPCDARRCLNGDTASLAFDEARHDTVQIPLHGLQWAPVHGIDERSFIILHRSVDGKSLSDNELVSSSSAEQVGRGDTRPQFKVMHSYGIHLAQDDRFLKDLGRAPTGVVDVQVLKASRLAPLSPPPVDSALLYEHAIALDRKSAEVVWVAATRDVFSAMYSGEDGSIYAGFLGDLDSKEEG